MNNNEDKVAQIMEEWYAEMVKHTISVQPKASTILGTILAKHLSTGARDVWAEAMTIKGGEFANWYSTLSQNEKLEYEEGRQIASERFDPRHKQLLKG
tara:strand:- start:928 stop:1221 length:294 start_codon:yes stop_codon:yes gene_type:complete